MARNDKDFEDEKESAGGFERFLVLIIPIIFTIVLVGVLLILFNMDIRNSVLGFAKKVPIVQNWVPEPNLDPEKTKLQESKEEMKSVEATVKELKNQLVAKETELEQERESNAQQEAQLNDLASKLEALKQESVEEVPEENIDVEYQKQIDDLAKMYANMSPSKAAPILQNMTLEETVLLFNSMKNDSRMAILEKMDPKVAAEVTMLMKDTKSALDLQIAALQSRLKKNDTTSVPTPTNLNKSQLSQTFANMTPKSAADLLFQTYKISPDKTLEILRSVTDATRSSLLGQMSSIDPSTTAIILNKLMSK
ncbi:MotE family protein [Paenibacillus sp. FA6]|uniref:MotE family protein n=1 Tax=Paenibacillus sp. FA6 TaxID=3413029 RepID=UPI003F65BEF1